METSRPLNLETEQLHADSRLQDQPGDLVSYSWKNLCVTVDNGKKTILDNSYGDVKAGEVVGLIGSSGAGKTTLLNLLAENKMASNTKVSGDFQLNYRNSTNRPNIKKYSAFVRQQDLFLPYITPRELLTYAMDLLSTEKREIKRQKINTILKELNLVSCQNTMIGNFLVKGLSGGEKRRLSIALEILSNPKILFLDEPTSGLDSFSALLAVSILRKEATNKRRMIICSLHQPSFEILDLLDKIIVLDTGRVLFNGPVQKLIETIKSAESTSLRTLLRANGELCPEEFDDSLHKITVPTENAEYKNMATLNSISEFKSQKPKEYEDISFSNNKKDPEHNSKNLAKDLNPSVQSSSKPEPGSKPSSSSMTEGVAFNRDANPVEQLLKVANSKRENGTEIKNLMIAWSKKDYFSPKTEKKVEDLQEEEVPDVCEKDLDGPQPTQPRTARTIQTVTTHHNESDSNGLPLSPPNHSQRPSLLRQFWTLIKREIFNYIRNRQYFFMFMLQTFLTMGFIVLVYKNVRREYGPTYEEQRAQEEDLARKQQQAQAAGKPLAVKALDDDSGRQKSSFRHHSQHQR